MRSAALAALLLLTLAGACTRPPAPRAAAAPAPPAELLWGGDTRAWLVQTGDGADSSYCRATLRLPLDPEPVWRQDYSEAEFSRRPPTQILHYAGRLIVNAESTQLMVIDAAGGTRLSSEDYYLRSAEVNQAERFTNAFLTPAGQLIVSDSSLRVNCFALGDQLARLWAVPANREVGALVCDDRNVYTYWDLQFRALAQTDGARVWRYPLSEPSYGVTLSRSGVVLWYSRQNQLRAWEAASGKPLWTVEGPAQYLFAPIDEARGTVHALRSDEVLECRDLQTGKLEWSYDWSVQLPRDARVALARAHRLTDLQLLQSTYCIGPSGSYLLLTAGIVVALDPAGQVRWTRRLDSVVGGGLLLDNALLVGQSWSSRSPAPDIDAFSAKRPDWAAIEAAGEDATAAGARNDGRRRRAARLFGMTRALALDDGRTLDSVEPAVVSTAGFCPAGGNLVVGGIGNGERWRGGKHVIAAYNWLE